MTTTNRLASPLTLLGPVLTAWTLVAPPVLGFDGSRAALANHIAFTMAFAPLAILATALRPALAASAAGGAWLALAPWATGYASTGTAAWLNDLIVGVLLITWSAITAAGTRPTHQPGTPPAGLTHTTSGSPDQRSAR